MLSHRRYSLSRIAGLVLVAVLLAASVPSQSGERLISGPGISGLMPLNPDIVESYRSRGLTIPRSQTEAAFASRLGSQINRVTNPTQLNASGTTTLKALVILVDFTTNPPGGPTVRYSPGIFDSMLFGTSYVRGGADPTTNKTLKNFYSEVSYGSVDIVTLNLPSAVGWVTVQNPYSYYCAADGQHDNGFGSFPRNVEGLVIDACLAADPYVDFSKYAVGGVVQNLFIIHSGTGAEWSREPAVIWSHAGSVGYYDQYVDGVRIDGYSMEPECGGNTTGYNGAVSGPFLPTVGVYAHEFGHVLGLPDEYDYGYESQGTGRMSLMAGGSWSRYPDNLECNGNSPAHPSGWGVSRLGFVTPTNIIGLAQGVELPPIETTSAGAMLKVEQPGSSGREYWLLENRQQTGFDQGLIRMTSDAHGLVVYHVDENVMDRMYWRPNEAECVSGSVYQGTMNCNCATLSPNHSNGEKWYGLSVEQADGLYELELGLSAGNAGDFYSSFSGKTAFDTSTTPNTSSYYGCNRFIAARNITEIGDTIRLDVTSDAVPPSVTVLSPNGSEVWVRGSFRDITWNATDNVGVRSVDILLSKDGGASFPDTIVKNHANDGTYTWCVSDVWSGQCLIKVVAFDIGWNVAEDASNYPFEITIQSQSAFLKAIGGSGIEVGCSVVPATGGGFAATGQTRTYGSGERDVLLTRVDNIGAILWTKTVGGSSADYGTSVVETFDGGFVLTGGTFSYGNGDYDLILSKFDSAGNHLWTKTLGDAFEDYGLCVIQTADSGLVVTGTTGGFGATSNDLLLAKFDSAGSLLWTKVLGGSGDDFGVSVVEAADGGIVTTGRTNSFGAGGNDILLAKFTSYGTHLWTKVFGGGADDFGSSIVAASDSGFVVAGTTDSYGAGAKDLFIAKFDSLGVNTWMKTLGGIFDDCGSSVMRMPDNGFVVTGGTYSFGAGFQDALLAKFDSGGNHIWSSALGGSDGDSASCIVRSPDGGFVVTGGTTSFGAGSSDMMLAKLDAQGTSCTGVTLLSPDITSPTPTAGSPAVTVTSGSLTANSPAPTVTSPVLIATTVCETETGIDKPRTAIVKNPAYPFNVRVSSPVSVSARAVLTIPTAATMRASLYDVSGRRAGKTLEFRDLNAGTHVLELPVSHLRSGVYFLVFEGAGAREIVKIVKIN